jgi:endonuclease-3
MSDVDKALVLLKKIYSQPAIALKSKNPFEMLVATILSAQCTDKRVNGVTKSLFKKYKTVKDFAQSDVRELERDIHSTGFYRNKARHINSSAQRILKDFDGRVPRKMAELLTLPGVARKTANVVLYNAFGKNEGIAVDTHVARVSQRLGLTKNFEPVKIEIDLMRVLKQKEWGLFSLRLIQHGRQTCAARNPQCLSCILQKICPSKKIFFPNG